MCLWTEQAEPALAKKPEERNYEERYNVWEYKRFLNKNFELMKEKKLKYSMEKNWSKTKLKTVLGKIFQNGSEILVLSLVKK